MAGTCFGQPDSEDGELATFVVEDAGPPGTPLLAGAARRSDAGRSPPGERGGEGQGLALAQMRLAVEDGVLMVLGPEGDPVPPQAVVAALAPERGGRLCLPDGASVPASRVVVALEAQRLGRLGRQETGEAWIMAMLRDDGWAEPASDRALSAERHDALAASPVLEPRTGSDGGAAPTVEAVSKGEPADAALADAGDAAWMQPAGPVPAAEDISREGRQVGEPVARVSPPRAAAGAVVATGQRSDRARDRAAAQRGAAATSRLAWAPGDPSPTSAPVEPDPDPEPLRAMRGEEAVLGGSGPDGAALADRLAADRSAEVPRAAPQPDASGSMHVAPGGSAVQPEIDPDRMVLVVIRGVPEDARLSAGVRDDDGSWLLTPLDLSTVTIALGTERPDADGDLGITGIALTEAGDLTAICETVPLADYLADPGPDSDRAAARLPGADAARDGTSSGPAARRVALKVDPQAWSGGGFDALVIRDLPAGARLSAGSHDAAIGGWVLRPQDLHGLAIVLPAGLNGDFTVTLLGIALRAGGPDAARILGRIPVGAA